MCKSTSCCCDSCLLPVGGFYLNCQRNWATYCKSDFLLFCVSGSAGGFLVSGAFRSIPQWLIFASPADVPSSRLRHPLQLPWGFCPGFSLSTRPQPVHLPSLHRPLLCFSGHGAASGPCSQQPRTLPLRLCSNIHLILLQEGLGQSQGLRQ